MRDYLFQPTRGVGEDDPVLRALRDDVAAIRHALSSAFPYGCEVWEDHRLVGRFFAAAPGVPAPPPTEPSSRPPPG